MELKEVFAILAEGQVKRLDFDIDGWKGCAYWIGKNVIRIDLKKGREG